MMESLRSLPGVSSLQHSFHHTGIAGRVVGEYDGRLTWEVRQSASRTPRTYRKRASTEAPLRFAAAYHRLKRLAARSRP
jgi:hypothetical protein